jgi:malonate-semialdehyde dehydrogenase (acetylating)/methylmalonate-semialdehyde dehydrogenase
MATTSTRSVCPCLIDGSWTESTAGTTTEVWNPSTGEVIARTPQGGAEDVDRAAAAALKAFPAWREAPASERARLMFRFHGLLLEHTEEIARIVSREHGKTRVEARASVQRGIEMVEFACGVPSLLAGEVIENIAPEIDCETIRHPLGVVAGITPFNFPAMVPLWMFPIALVCGNCFVLKPSERVPLSAQRIVELLIEAGLPRGVLSVVHGGKECVDALLAHPGIRAISFVGSTRVAEHVYKTGTAHGKRVQANGGAKNHLIIMPDAHLDATVASLMNSAFGCAGERCMAGSLAIPVGGIGDEIVGTLVERAGRMKVGRTDDGQDVDMGPLISRRHQENVRHAIDEAEKEGARIALDGRRLNARDTADGFFVGPTVVDHVRPDHRIAREEIFGPVLSVARADSLAEAIALGEQCPYGNGAVIYTSSGHAAREFKHRFNAGMIGINVGVPAPMAWFPFTGWNASFFGDLHIQGKEGVLFYTQQRMIMTRWFEGGPPSKGKSGSGPASSWR